MVKVKLFIEDETGKVIEVTKTYDSESLITHDFDKMEGLIEHIRTDMLPLAEQEILQQNQQAYRAEKKGR